MKAAASERPKPTSNSEDSSYSECTWVHNLNGLWNLKTKIIKIIIKIILCKQSLNELRGFNLERK